MKRKVYLDGELGERYGKELVINANSFGEVFCCLEANYPGVKQYLLECHEKNIGFICEVADKPLNSELELALQYPTGDMYICPQPAGAKGAVGKILMAIAFVTVMYFTFGTGMTFTAWLQSSAISAKIALGVGANLVMQGIQELMAPDPATENVIEDEDYLYQGTGQVIVEGDPVPVLYGRMRVPGRPISFSVRNTSQRFYNLSGKTSTSSFTAENEGVELGDYINADAAGAVTTHLLNEEYIPKIKWYIWTPNPDEETEDGEDGEDPDLPEDPD